MAKSTKITIKTDSLLVVRSRISSRLWCAQCGEEVDMIALERSPAPASVPPHEWEQLLNSGDLHRTRTPGGAELFCLNSLLARLAGR